MKYRHLVNSTTGQSWENHKSSSGLNVGFVPEFWPLDFNNEAGQVDGGLCFLISEPGRT